jgi:hypothetical protein
MSWYTQAQHRTAHAIIAKIKDILRTHKFFLKIMDDYHIPLDNIDKHLQITFCDLNGKFAEGNGEEIKLDQGLLHGNFFKDNFHFVVHEFYHWVKRRSEALFYFNDDEEVQSFTLGIAWELIAGKSEQNIAQVFYPIIEGHFKERANAQQMFAQILGEAGKIVAAYRQ